MEIPTSVILSDTVIVFVGVDEVKQLIESIIVANIGQGQRDHLKCRIVDINLSIFVSILGLSLRNTSTIGVTDVRGLL